VKHNKFGTLIVVTIAALSLPAAAEVVYTAVAASIPINGYYGLDLNQDGPPDFTVRSALLQDQCQFGDGYVWSLTVNSSNGNAVVKAASRMGDNNASALPGASPVSSSQSFYPGSAMMAELSWGSCGLVALGEWLNVPYRYLGLELRGPGSEVHYGWAKVTNIVYVDQYQHPHTSTILSGFAYESVPGQAILAGQISDAP
jgi:hypothetical protein